MTFLQLVNAVHKKLRKSEVTAISDTTYAEMIAEFVNDAKTLCEDAANWSSLRTTLTVNCVADETFGYTLTGGGDRLTVLEVYNSTQQWWMHKRNQRWMTNQLVLQTSAVGSPLYWAFNGSTGGDADIEVYPKPNVTDAIGFDVVLRPADLSADTDTLDIPSRPVIAYATAFAARERGETGGTSVAEYFAIAERLLGDAIQQDLNKFWGDEDIVEVV